MLNPRNIDVQVPGVGRVACYEWGRADAAETVLCVHGLTRNGRDFDYLAQALAADFRVISVDMPGRGQSDWLADTTQYNYASYTGQIIAIIKLLGLSRLHWVGTSMGGIMAMMAANAWPGLIQSLVLNDIGTVIAAAGRQRIVLFSDQPTAFATRAEALAAMRVRWAPFGIRSEEHWAHMAAHGISEKDGRFAFTSDPAIVAAFAQDKGAVDSIADIEMWGLWPALQTIPMLLIRGMNSDLLTHEAAATMQKTHPRLMLHEIAGVGHAPALMEDSQTGLIRDWLQSVIPRIS